MSTDYASLLSLDSFASEESIRVAAYSRAVEVQKIIQRAPPTASIAAIFIEFVSDERWRLDALDVALRSVGHRSSVDRIITEANEVVDWVNLLAPSKPEPAPQPQTTTKKVEVKKKSSK